MPTILSDAEVRVLGALVEKESTTPEYYPLTLNALINACNQKSNRNPVVNYDGRTVGEAIDGLKAQGLVRVIMGGDSRVPKYKHYFQEAYELTPAAAALLCELMLRGPQTLSELRSRIERFGVRQTPEELEATFTDLLNRADGPLVARLPRQPGQREARVAHLLSGEVVLPEEEEMAPTASTGGGRSTGERITALETELAAVREEMAALRAEFAIFRQQFE